MKDFNERKVFTCVNADKLLVGSRCILGDSLAELERKVEKTEYRYSPKLNMILPKEIPCRFKSGCIAYGLAYFLEHPKCKPFETAKALFNAIKLYGVKVKGKRNDKGFIVKIDIENPGVCIKNSRGTFWVSFETLFENYVFSFNNTPCGVPILEDTNEDERGEE